MTGMVVVSEKFAIRFERVSDIIGKQQQDSAYILAGLVENASGGITKRG